MFGHYLTVALRNLARYRLHTAVSVLVLTLGLTCFLAGVSRRQLSHELPPALSQCRPHRRRIPRHARAEARLRVAVLSVQLRSAWRAARTRRSRAPGRCPLSDYRSLRVRRWRAKAAHRYRARRPEVPHDFPVRNLGRRSSAPRSSDTTRSSPPAPPQPCSAAPTRSARAVTVTVNEGGTVDVTIVAVIADPPVNSTLQPARVCGRRDSTLLLAWDAVESVSPLPAGGWFNTIGPDLRTVAAGPFDDGGGPRSTARYAREEPCSRSRHRCPAKRAPGQRDRDRG